MLNVHFTDIQSIMHIWRVQSATTYTKYRSDECTRAAPNRLIVISHLIYHAYDFFHHYSDQSKDAYIIDILNQQTAYAIVNTGDGQFGRVYISARK